MAALDRSRTTHRSGLDIMVVCLASCAAAVPHACPRALTHVESSLATMEVLEAAAPAQQEAPAEQEAQVAEADPPPAAEESEEDKQAKMTQAVADLVAQKTALLEVMSSKRRPSCSGSGSAGRCMHPMQQQLHLRCSGSAGRQPSAAGLFAFARERQQPLCTCTDARSAQPYCACSTVGG